MDASSAQSRADVLVIGLSAVLVLTGLQWVSLKPKPLVAVSGPICVSMKTPLKTPSQSCSNVTLHGGREEEMG